MLDNLSGREKVNVYGIADPMAEQVVTGANFHFGSSSSKYEQVSGDVLNAVLTHLITSTERRILAPESATEGQIGISALVGPKEAPYSGGLVTILESIGMDTSFIRHLPQGDLAQYILLQEEKGSKSYGFLGRGHCPSRYMFAKKRHGLDLDPIDHHTRLLDTADIIYVSLITAAVINKPDKRKLTRFVKDFNEAGKVVVLDTNFREALSEYWDKSYPPLTCLRVLAKQASVILAGKDDLIGMNIIKAQDPMEKQIKESFRFFWTQNREALVIYKNGEDGIYYRLPNNRRILNITGMSVLKEDQFEDSVGAGDAFGGGTVTGLIEYRQLGYDTDVMKAVVAIAHGAALKCLGQRGAGLSESTASFLVESRRRLDRDQIVEQLKTEYFS